mgnify:CR=1 FL=1
MSGTPLEIERKLLIEEPDLAALEAASESVSEIVQTYLVTSEWDAERVRRRLVRDARGEHLQLTHTRKRAVSHGVVEEDEREVDETEYAALLTRTDADRHPVHKVRHVVPWAGRVLEVDGFRSPRTLWLLEVELADETGLDAELELPPWISVVREVTGDPAYSNAALAYPPAP